MEKYIVVNMKTYPQNNNGGALHIARICEKVANESEITFALCPQQTDLKYLCDKVKLPIFAQHMDNIPPGAGTGYVSPEAVKSAGARGVLINHSEHRLTIAEISDLVKKARELDLTSIVCTNDIMVSKSCALFEPDFIAVEPPELIGGDISVTSADPDIVINTAKEIREIKPEVKVLTGAGVKNGEDVAMALKLGTQGVLLASGVVKSRDIESTIRDLVSKII